ncbi:MAG: cyclic nucleotide-binding domain-containing protein [Pseudomonadota bacterium]
MQILNSLTSAVVLIHIASLLYVVAFAVSDQLLLRGLVLVATILYILYYYFVPDQPLWEPIIWSLILGAANLWVTVKIVLERTTFNLSDDEKRLYDVFSTLSPGEFRKLLGVTTWNTVQDNIVLTEEDKPVERLFYILDGTTVVSKQNREFPLDPGIFIGEVAFFLNQNASATTTLQTGGNYVYWESDTFKQLQKKNPGIRVAIYELLNRDMATKVSAS